MDEQLSKIEIAAAAIAKLNELHSQFVQRLTSQPDVPAYLGTFRVLGPDLYATSLGVDVRVTHRPVMRDGAFRAMEYTFSARYKDADVTLFHAYLHGTGLYRDSAAKARLWDLDNRYIAERVLTLLAVALMDSPLFAPDA